MVDRKDQVQGMAEGAAPFDRGPVTISATEAKNRFGELLEMAGRGPVHVRKNGRTVGVMLSPEQFQAYEALAAKPGPNPLIMRLHEESKKRWGKVYEALAK